MRLSDVEKESILAAVRLHDPDAQVLLFGSRANDSKRGGDIDLLIYSPTIGPAEKRAIRRAICDAIGEQKIDIIVAADASEHMVRIAQRTGVALR